MILFESIGEIESMQDGGSAAIAVGNFDGVHRGHQSIIRRMVSNARIAGYKSAVFTFSNHPRNMLKTGEPVKNILYREDKIRLIQEMGVDWLFQIPFDRRPDRKSVV